MGVMMFDEDFEKAFAGGDAEMLVKVRAYRTLIPGKYANAFGLPDVYIGWLMAKDSADKSQAAFEVAYLDTLMANVPRSGLAAALARLRYGGGYRQSFGTRDLCNMWKGWGLYVKSN